MIEGTKIVDFHGHVGRWDRYKAIDDPNLMLHAMDSVGKGLRRPGALLPNGAAILSTNY